MELESALEWSTKQFHSIVCPFYSQIHVLSMVLFRWRRRISANLEIFFRVDLENQVFFYTRDNFAMHERRI